MIGVEDEVRRVIPKEELETLIDNLGMPISGINVAYGNTGTIGPEDADMLISLTDIVTFESFTSRMSRSSREFVSSNAIDRAFDDCRSQVAH